MRAVALALSLTGLLAAPAAAQLPPSAAVAVDPALRARADALIPILAGGGDYDETFAPSFRAAVPAERFRTLAAGLRAQLGQPRAVDTLAVPQAWRAQATIAYEKGTATLQFALDPSPPHRVTELRITGTTLRDDSLARVEADLRALPGTAALGIYSLDGAAPTPLLDVRGTEPAPLGSAFKLWVLAEAARQVAATGRRWTDVVPLGPPSLPSGLLQSWPKGTPVTLQALATLMISISDNTATDTLMHALGRAPLDRGAAAAGLSTPVLTTREAFVLKGDTALRTRWLALPPPGRAALLTTDGPRFDVTPLNPGMFGNGPLATDSVEWFAAPRATAALLGRLRLDPIARAILSVNKGLDPATAGRFAYVGFKGGSEPGVLSLNWIVRTPSGRWLALTSAWHRPDGETNEAQFLALTTRALMLVADR